MKSSAGAGDFLLEGRNYGDEPMPSMISSREAWGFCENRLRALRIHTRRPKPALKGIVFNDCFLWGIKFSVLRQPFISNDFFSFNLFYKRLTG
jgi:hypothetical protein